MNTQFPDELIDLYGTMAISRIAQKRTKAIYDGDPKIAEALKEARAPAEKSMSLDHFDVENGGMDDEFEDFMREGFEELIPGPGHIIEKPFPPIEIPPEVVYCARILRALRAAQEELATQREQQERLQVLVDGLRKNAHPLIQIFAALFRYGLETVNARIEELISEISFLTRLAMNNDCL